MKIALGADHAGYELKAALVDTLQEWGHEVLDLGTTNATDSVDYPDFGAAVGHCVADGRADLQTLAAVGGPPRVRRRFAASSAGFVTGLGTLVGTVSGLVVAWVLLPLFGSTSVSGQLSRGPLAIPWGTVALVVLAVPVVTSAVAWATTRSRIALTRRPD